MAAIVQLISSFPPIQSIVPKNANVAYSINEAGRVGRFIVFEKEGFAGVVFIVDVAEAQFVAAFPMSVKVDSVNP